MAADVIMTRSTMWSNPSAGVCWTVASGRGLCNPCDLKQKSACTKAGGDILQTEAGNCDLQFRQPIRRVAFLITFD